MRIGREFQATVLLLDDHREEALALEEVPDFGRHVTAAMRDVEIVDHPAEFLAGPIEKSLFLGGEHRRFRAEQFRPVGLAGEEFAVPPHGAGFEGFALGRRHRRQHPSVDAHERPSQQALPQWHHVEQCQSREQQPKKSFPETGRLTDGRVGEEQHAESRRVCEQAQSLVREVQQCDDEQDRDDAALERQCPGSQCQQGEGYEKVAHERSLLAQRSKIKSGRS